MPAGTLSWSCWETVEHIADDLFDYAAQLAPVSPDPAVPAPIATRSRPGGPLSTVFAEPGSGTAGLLRVLDACGGLLAAVVATAPAERRAYHSTGASDAEGFAAMGVVEVLVHGHDVATGLSRDWQPPADLCSRVLGRLFPEAPDGNDPWQTLLWATGRGELPGVPGRTSWSWDPTPRAV